jgi:hypothetical protein
VIEFGIIIVFMKNWEKHLLSNEEIVGWMMIVLVNESFIKSWLLWISKSWQIIWIVFHFPKIDFSWSLNVKQTREWDNSSWWILWTKFKDKSDSSCWEKLFQLIQVLSE